MNKNYRLIYNELTNTWVAVSEASKGRGKRTSGAVLLAAVGLLTALAQAPALAAPPNPPAPTQLPTGGQVVAGQANISQSAATLTVNQSSNRAAIDWQTFNVGSQARVNFKQPSASSVTLNRVLDANPSQIFGRISANGQVFLSNPNGVYFSPTASVDVGALVATTHSISNADFMAGGNTFTRNGATGSVVNEGNLTASLGGYIALLAPEVRNNGIIVAQLGTVALAAGEAFELQFDGSRLANIRVEPATIAALVENGNAVQAPGGLIILSAQAANRLQGGVVNNTGSLEATGLIDNGGVIRLEASDRIVHSGSIKVDAAANSAGKGGTATLIASLANPDSVTEISGSISARGGDLGGDGGFIETSAAHLNIADSARVTTAAAMGLSGSWLLDPVDFTIAATGGDMTGAALTLALDPTTGGNVTILSSNGASGTAGDVNVNDVVSWSANKLTLNAQNNININANMDATGSASLALVFGQGAVALNNTSNIITGNGAAVNLPAGTTNFTTLQGSNGVVKPYTVITILGEAGSLTTTDLQGMNGNGALNYALGGNIDATPTSLWNPYWTGIKFGFTKITLSGTLDGLGHTITGLYLNNGGRGVGLIGTLAATGKIRNIGMLGGDVIGGEFAGALVGSALAGSTISNSYASTRVTGSWLIGGLVGFSEANIDNCYATGNVSGAGNIGGLIGDVDGGLVSNSYATGNVSGPTAGGLVGIVYNWNSLIKNSYATGIVSGASNTGGLVGFWHPQTTSMNQATNSFWNTTNNPTLSGGAGTGLTTAQMMQKASFTGWNIANTGGSSAIWRIYEGSTAPLLRSFMTSLTLAADTSTTYNGIAQSGSAFSLITNVLGAAATGTSAGVYNGYYSTQQGYDLIGGSLTIGKANATVTANSGTATYNGLNQSVAGFTASGLVNGETASVLTGVTASGNGTNAGSYAVAASGTDSNYNLTLVDGSLAIAKAHLTVTADPRSRRYGGANPTLTTTVSGFVNGENLSTSGVTGAGSATTPATQSTPRGWAYIRAGIGNLTAANYDFSNLVDGRMNINYAHLVVTADNQSRLYGEANPTLTITVTGFVNGETLSTSDVSGAGSATTTAISTTNVGTATITAGVGTLASWNYDFLGGLLRAGTLTIGKANATVTANSGTVTYNGLNQSVAGFTASGLVNGETTSVLTGVAVSGGKNAGSYTVVASGTDSNYNLTMVDGTLTIDKAHLIVTADPQSRLYGAANPTLTTTVSGFVNNQNLSTSGVTGAGSATTTAVSATNVGTATISAASGTLTASNYDFTTLTAGTLTIDKAHLTVTADNQSRLYGAANPTLTTTVSGFVNSEVLGTSGVSGAGSATTTAATSTNVGTAAITAASGTLAAGNYDFTAANGTLTIDKAHLTVTADPQSRLYGAANPTLTTTVSGFVNNQNLSTSGVTGAGSATTTAAPTTNVGTAAISAASGTLAAGNYDFTAANGTLTIDKAHLTVTADNQSRLYGAANPTLTTTVSGFVNNQNLSTSGVTGAGSATTTAVPTTNVGTAAIIAASGTLAAGNYDFTAANGTANITAKTLTLSATKAYDGTSSLTGAVSLGGYVGSETLTYTGATANDAHVATAGKYISAITLANGTNGGLASNYAVPTLNNANAAVTINAATLTPTVTNTGVTRAYDGTTNAPTGFAPSFSYSGLISGDTTAALTNTGSAYNSKDVGSANKVTVSGLSISGITGTNSSASSDYVLSATSKDVVANITTAALTVSANNDARFYSQTDTAGYAGVSYSGFVNGETSGTAGLGGTLAIARSGLTGTGSTDAAGSYTLTPSGKTAGNYTITPQTGTYTIVPAGQLLVNVTDAPTTYGTAATYAVASAKYMTGSTVTTASSSASGNNITVDGVTFALAPASAANSTGGFLKVGSYQLGGTITSGTSINFSGNLVVVGAQQVSAKTLTASASGVSKAYDGTKAMPGVTIGLAGKETGDVVTVSGSGAFGQANVGTGLSYQISGINLGGTDSANYVLTGGTTFSNTDGAISKAHLTVTADPQSRLYGAANPTLTTTVSGFVNSEVLSTSGVTGAGSATTTAAPTTNVGTAAISAAAGTLAASNYDFANLVAGTLTIDKAHLTVTADPQSRLYGAANPTLTTTVSGFVNNQNLSTSGVTGAGSATTTAAPTTNVGTAAISAASGTLAASNYDFATLTAGTLTIDKAHLTVTADPQSRLYGAANPTLTTTVSGFVNNQNLSTSGVTGAGSATTTAAPTTNVGTAAISAAAGTLAAGNYDFTTLTAGTLTIDKAHLTVTADNQSRLYGAANPTLTTTVSGFVNDQNLGTSGVTGAGSATTTAVPTTNVGTAAISAASGTLAASNYDFATLTAGTLTIDKAHLTVTADNQSRLYGAANPTLTTTVSGFVNNQNLSTSGVTGAGSATTTAVPTTNVGTATITAATGTLAASNYDFSNLVAGTLTIDKAHLTVTADPQSRLYGATNPTFSETISGYVNSQDANSANVTGTATGSTTATATTGVGTATITGNTGTLAAANYDFTKADGTLTIDKAHLTVTADNQSRLYGAANPTLTTTVSGFVNSEVLGTSGVTGAGSATTTAAPTTNVGTAAISAASGTLTASNYDFSNLVAGTLTIDKAHLAVTADNQSRLYGAANPTLITTVSGFVNGEVLGTSGVSGAGSATTTAATSTNVGTAAISAASGTLVASNYDFSNLVAGTLTIDKAHLTVTADNQSRLYGAANPTLITTVSGFVNGQNLSTSGVTGAGSATTTAVSATNVGTATITAASGTLAASNYDFSNLVAGTLTIDKAHLTVTADNQSRQYGAANPTLITTVSGFVNGQNLSSSGVTGAGSATTTAVPTTNVGTATITAASGTLAASNYDFSNLVAGTLTIDKAHLTVTADSGTGTYSGVAQSVSGFTATGLVNNEAATVLTGVTASGTGTNAGSYTSTASGTDSNYTLTMVDGTLTIDKANATVTANSGSGTYSGVAQSVSGFTATGLVNNEAASVLTGVTASGTGTNAGSYTSTASGTDSNYNLTMVDGALTIAKANATVTANSDLTKTYSGVSQSVSGFTATGLVNSETEIVLTSVSATGSGTNAGSYSTVASGTDSNYNLTMVDGALTIGKAAATVTANSDLTKTYSGVSQSVSGFTATGLVNSETEIVLTSVSATGSGTNAGSYSTVASGTDLNYNLTLVNGSIVIGKAAATVTANSDLTKTYSGVSQSVSGFTASGLVNSEAATVLTGVTASGSGTNAGTYTSTASGTDSNYTLTMVDGALTIDKAHLTVTADNQSRLYGAANPVLTTTVSGFVNSEVMGTSGVTGAGSATTTAVPSTNVGTAAISATSGTLAASNYDFTNLVAGTLTIDKAHLTVTADNQSRLYGAANPTLTSTITGYVNNENASSANVNGTPTQSTTATATTVGTASITAAANNLAAANYDFAYVSGTLNIDKVTYDALQAAADAAVISVLHNVAPSIPQSSVPDLVSAPSSSSAPATAPTSESATPTPQSTPVPALATTPAPAVEAVAKSSAVIDAPPAGTGASAGVSLVVTTKPTRVETGIVSVSLPKGTSTEGVGFRVPLPIEVATPSGTALTQATGTAAPTTAPAIEVRAVIEGRTVPLPAWLRYTPAQKLFEAAAVPDGGLPITIEITVAGQRTLMVISERSN
jgi:filamentous hemagglutinin family protein